jgi:hypothetical protein
MFHEETEFGKSRRWRLSDVMKILGDAEHADEL